jgi:large subunit ribosomal protein L23
MTTANKQNPFEIIKSFYVTEKSRTLQELKNNKSNRSVARCDQPKYVFLVDPRANKHEIKDAVEEIYKEHGVKVTKVNTIRVKPKPCGRRGREGTKSSFKKAIVTLEPKDNLEDL